MKPQQLTSLLPELIQALEAHPKIKILDLCLGEPAPQELIQEIQNTQSFKFSDAVQHLYATYNGILIHWSYEGDPRHSTLPAQMLEVGQLPDDFQRGVGLLNMLPITAYSKEQQEQWYDWSDMSEAWEDTEERIDQFAHFQGIQEVDEQERQRINLLLSEAYSHIYMFEDRRSDQGTALMTPPNQQPILAEVFQSELYPMPYFTQESYIAERIITGGALPLEHLQPKASQHTLEDGFERLFAWLKEEFK